MGDKHIGRFEIVKILGKGAQSVVYLGYDPHLQREVAIKTLHFGQQNDHREKIAALLQEARTVSKLSHPDIVPIFEAGEHDDDPYLVFEYVEGKTLADELRENGPIAATRAVQLLCDVLDAVVHAHRHQIIHRDLKPSNILLNPDGMPRVMDFGIAARISDAAAEDRDLVGTPAYLSPEYIAQGTISVQQDVFAAGLVLYEMLAGRRAVQGSDIYAIMRRIASPEAIFSPGDCPEAIDEKLGDIMLKALAKNPLDRYGSALEMKQALEAYLTPGEDGPTDGANQSTLDFLLRRMRHKSDFPALSESVSAINKIVSSEQESITRLSNTILKDFALANKILKLVNSAFYSQFGGGAISTISRAVVILGFDAVRNIAITLVLFEHLQNKAHAVQLKDEFLRTLFSGILAREIAAGNQERDTEEAFICAMFHNLGRLLSMFYFPEEAKEIEKVMQQKASSEETASAQVLGISYQHLGIGIAQTWGFPDQIIHSMRKLAEGPVKKPATHLEKLRVQSAFANEVCDMIATSSRDQRSGELRKLAARFGDSMPLPEKRLDPALEKSMAELAQYAGIIHLNLHQSPFGKQVGSWMGRAAGQGAPVEEDAALPDTILGGGLVGQGGELQAPGQLGSAASPDAQLALTAGIQDITNSLVEGCSVNDILRMILETMYRSMGFQRVLLCIKDGRQGTMNGRFGFGPDINLLANSFKFPMSYSADVFHAATSKGVDILIADINEPKIRERIPDWYRKTVAAQTFVLFPLNIKNTPVALIYADKDRAGEIVIPEKELSLLRTLRNQAVLAIKQSL